MTNPLRQGQSIPLLCLRTLCLTILFIALGIGFFALNRYTVREVGPGQLYRSGTLTQYLFDRALDNYQFKSVVNLTKFHHRDTWHHHEVLATSRRNVQYYNVFLNENYHAETPMLRKLVKVLEEAPKPILIHCRAGSDRTGLASAVYLLLQGATVEKAKEQFSAKYLALSDNSVGKKTLPFYEAWLNKKGKGKKLTSSRELFLEWINSEKPLPPSPYTLIHYYKHHRDKVTETRVSSTAKDVGIPSGA